RGAHMKLAVQQRGKCRAAEGQVRCSRGASALQQRGKCVAAEGQVRCSRGASALQQRGECRAAERAREYLNAPRLVERMLVGRRVGERGRWEERGGGEFVERKGWGMGKGGRGLEFAGGHKKGKERRGREGEVGGRVDTGVGVVGGGGGGDDMSNEGSSTSRHGGVQHAQYSCHA
ncbi:unnamed protein product, partial [Closterium sp. NIES-64]